MTVPKRTPAEYNPGNICADCVDICDNVGSETACNGTACDAGSVEQTCRGFFRAAVNEAEEIWGCVKQNQDSLGGNFITCSEGVMPDLERWCYGSYYCDCTDIAGSYECAVSGGGNYFDSDDCNGKLYPMPSITP